MRFMNKWVIPEHFHFHVNILRESVVTKTAFQETQKLTFNIHSQQTAELIPRIHKDTHNTHTHTHSSSPLCLHVLHCWLAELPEDVKRQKRRRW